MNARERNAACTQIGQLLTEVAGGATKATGADVDRFRRRPQGPHGHRLLLRSERGPRLPGKTRLEDARVLPDGKLCQTWSSVDDCDKWSVFVSWENAARGHMFELKAHFANAQIVGIHGDGQPIIDVRWKPDARQWTPNSILYIGNSPVLSTRTQSGREWTVGNNGKLYSMQQELEEMRLIRWDLSSGTHKVVASRECSSPIKQWVVFDDDTYAYTTRGGHEFQLINRDKPVWSGPRTDPMLLAQWSDSIWCICAGKHASLARRLHPTSHEDDLRLRYDYQHSWSMLNEAIAYVAKISHDQQCWVVSGDDPGPGFARVTNAFQREGSWCYWGLAEGHWFLMELLA